VDGKFQSPSRRGQLRSAGAMKDQKATLHFSPLREGDNFVAR